jgi:polyphenol oxidase
VSAAQHCFTDRTHGDLAAALDADAEVLEVRRRSVVDVPWTWLRQVHGADVVHVSRPGEHAGARADASVTAVPGAALAVQVADCAPVVLVTDGAVGVAHAGWRGLLGGVIGRTVVELRSVAGAGIGAGTVRAVIGPCIHAECYEFGARDLDVIAARFGDDVRATTAAGTPALDLVAAVRAALTDAGLGADDVELAGGCTACTPDRWYSHRARGERERQAGVVWLEP